MIKFMLFVIAFSMLCGCVAAQENSTKSEKDASCYVIRFSEPFEKKERDRVYPKRFQLLDICPQRTVGLAYQEAKIAVKINGETKQTSFDVVKTFENEDAAREFGEQNKIADTPFRPVSDCQIIRQIRFPLTKRPNTKTTPKLALLNTCVFDEVDRQRPSIEVVRNGEKDFRLFAVVKAFQSKAEAAVYARENGISDVDYK